MTNLLSTISPEARRALALVAFGGPALLATGAVAYDRFSVPFPVILIGAIVGMTYGVLAVGLVLAHRASRIVNFAHGEIGAFGASLLGVWVVQTGLPYWLVFPVVIVVSAGAGMAVEAVAVRRLRRAPAIMSLVATLGAATFLLTLSLAVNTQVRRGSTFPQPPGFPSFRVGALLVTPSYSAMLFLTPLIVLALAVFLRRSRFGIAIRAAADNRDAAEMAGIAAGRMSSIAWAIAGAIAGYTAILQFPQRGFVIAGQSLGPGLLVRALVAAVVARMTNLPVALAFGVVLGVVEQVMLWNAPSGGQVEVVLFVILLVSLLLQSREGGREKDVGSWTAVRSWDALPERMAAVPLIRWSGKIGAGLLIVGLLAVAATTNRSSFVMTLVVAYTLVGLSIYVVTGLGGQLSLGQFAIAGIGAAISYHTVRNGTGYPLGMFLAGLGAAGASVVIGLPALRIRGLMLAVTTLSFAVMSEAWLFQQPWMFGGGVDPGKPIIQSWIMETAKEYHLFVVPVLAVALWLTWNVVRTGAARRMAAQRDNEDAARAFGVPVTRVKLEAFAFAGFLAGVGGAAYAHSLSLVNAATFPAGNSITLVAITIIGGLSLMVGPFLGALYLIALPGFLPLDSAGLAASTLGWLLLILYFPGGLAQMVSPLRDRVIDALARRAGVDPVEARAEAMSELEAPLSRAVVVSRTGRAHAETTGDLLAVTGVRKHFGGVRAVEDVSFSVRRRETVGIIGPNGAGKTTLFEIVSGFVTPDAGRVVFDGHDITAMGPEERARLGLVRSFQDARLFPTLTVLETVRLAFEGEHPTQFLLSTVGWPSAVRRERARDERARELVQLMGLSSYRHKRIAELSTGTRRITELACIVALDPKLVLLDEPTSGIAQRESEAMAGLLRSLGEQMGTTFVVIEHDIPLVMGISDRIVAMESGAVIADGPPSIVRDDPRVVESYLGGDLVAIERSGTRTAARAGGNGNGAGGVAIAAPHVIEALRTVRGLGAARTAALIKHFDGAEGVVLASRDDFLAVPGIGARLADDIRQALASLDGRPKRRRRRPAPVE